MSASAVLDSPAYSDAAAAPFNTLLDALRAELAALDTGDAEAIELATRAKLSALIMARDAGPAARALLAEARDLDALASERDTGAFGYPPPPRIRAGQIGARRLARPRGDRRGNG